MSQPQSGMSGTTRMGGTLAPAKYTTAGTKFVLGLLAALVASTFAREPAVTLALSYGISATNDLLFDLDLVTF